MRKPCFFKELLGNELHGSIEGIMRGGYVLRWNGRKVYIERFKVIFVSLFVDMHGVPRVMFRDTCAEYDVQKKE